MSVRLQDGVASFAGVETCGSVWACPVCAGKITEVRRQDVAHLIGAHEATGGRVYMAAFTVPHHRFQSAAELKKAVADGWRKTCSGKAWKGWRERWNIAYTRALEVTHGANGWHPHLHCLFYLPGDLTQAEIWTFSTWLFQRWRRVIERAGLGTCTARVWKFEPATSTEAAGGYVTKWGADSEIARGVAKRGREVDGVKGRTPWELLEGAGQGDEEAGRLFREFAAAFKGGRQLTHSRGLKERYGLLEVSDEEAAAAEASAATTVGVVHREVFGRLHRAGQAVQLLEIVENGGWGAAERWLNWWTRGDGDGAEARGAAAAAGKASLCADVGKGGRGRAMGGERNGAA